MLRQVATERLRRGAETGRPLGARGPALRRPANTSRSGVWRLPASAAAALHAQARVDLHAAPGEEVVLENEADGVSDFLGLAQAPERNGRGHLC
jgi:hypothetical protein